jgi:hypothetical protein
VFFVLAAAFVARFHAGRRGALATAVLLTLAFLTKQSALIVALPLLVYLVAVHAGTAAWRSSRLCAGGGATWLLDQAHHGCYVYYVFMMPARMQQLDAVSVDLLAAGRVSARSRSRRPCRWRSGRASRRARSMEPPGHGSIRSSRWA